MFSFLFKKKQSHTYTRNPDKTWEKKSDKYSVLCQLLAENANSQQIVIAFFPKTMQELISVFQKSALAYSHTENVSDLTMCLDNTNKTIILLPIEIFTHQNFIAAITRTSNPLHFHFAEHYPKWSVENEYLTILNTSKSNPTVQFYNSLDEPFFQKFGGESVAGLLQKFGLQDKECISHRMIDKSIKNGQMKIDKSVEVELKGYSAEDWFNRNLRE